MAGGIAHDDDAGLRLVRIFGGTAFLRPGDGGFEIVDQDIEVLGDVLFARLARPDWRLPQGLVLEVERDTAEIAGCSDLCPAGFRWLVRVRRFISGDLAVKELGVETSEFTRVGCADSDGCELE